MKRVMLQSLLLAAVVVASPGALADYTVQIGAYAKPELADRAGARNVAEVHFLESTSGLTRIVVGRFRSSAEAQPALDALKAAGYHDAFISRVSGDLLSAGDEPLRMRVSPARDSRRDWTHLSKELRAKLVLLDGLPYIKEGDTFTALEEYRGQLFRTGNSESRTLDLPGSNSPG